jgi:IS30 family transposase
VSDEIMNMLSEYPKEYVRTITADNGKEFGDWKRIRDGL